MLTRRFYSCSVNVKQVLFKNFCLCIYDVALWTNFTMKSYKRMKACYVKCLNFFGYSRSYSVTTMLAEIDIPDFDSVVDDFKLKCVLKNNNMRCSNPVVRQLVMLHVHIVCVLIFCWGRHVSVDSRIQLCRCTSMYRLHTVIKKTAPLTYQTMQFNNRLC